MATGERKPFSVTIHFPSGDPDGLAIVGNITRTSQGFFFPRSIFSDGVKEDTLNYLGVYVLWGDDGTVETPKTYIGEGNLWERLRHHTGGSEKDFWAKTFAFTSKDGSLNKAHAGYIESRLLDMAEEANRDVKRCELVNKSDSKKDTLTGAAQADAELYLEDMLLYLRVMGVRFFEKVTDDQILHLDSREIADDTSADFLRLKGKNIEARGYQDGSYFVVFSESRAVGDEDVAPSLYPKYSALREHLKDEGILAPANNGEFYELTQNYTFGSPSEATGVLLGNSSSPSLVWKQRE